jgi:asparagine synthase (glutamine-hydrolysing)
VIVYNGELYNHLDLRRELNELKRAPPWRGHSDTETLIAAIAAWGPHAALKRCIGMFAFALWDRQDRILHLGRDRMGEKPLYYGWVPEGFVFASELKALRPLLGRQNDIDRSVLNQYFQFSYVPCPFSIFRRIYKLEPGCVLSLSAAALKAPRDTPPQEGSATGGLRVERYWALRATFEQAELTEVIDEQRAIDDLEQLLIDSVSRQSIADVPLGAFLSGGVDSSTVVALMQANASSPVKTYTIGFADPAYDESAAARAVAQHLGTDHTELKVSSAELMDVIPKLSGIYCEPFADSSQIPALLVAKLAATSVKVAMSGDGGDELFGGYNRYVWVHRVWENYRRLPGPARRAAVQTLRSAPRTLLRQGGAMLGVNRLEEKVAKLVERIDGLASEDELYRRVVTEWPNGSLVLGATPVPSLIDLASWVTQLDNVETRMMVKDTMTYLPDDILCKVDRAAMSVGLETRVPLLDHRVVEMAFRLPVAMKIRNGTSKWALRQVLYKHVPRTLIERPKSGFAVPVGDWLRGPLRDWGEGLLNEHQIANEGYLDSGAVKRKWLEHQSGARDWSAALWSVLMFEAWLRESG